MPGSLSMPLAHRPELVVKPLGDRGEYVVKGTQTGSYYHLGPEEAFLLQQLDGRQGKDDIRTAPASTRRLWCAPAITL